MKTSTTSTYNEGLGPKKTVFVMVTVVGCIAILWPKVFYPMMFGSSPPTQSYKDLRQGGTGYKCCEVILDKEMFLNASALNASVFGPQLFRKENYNIFTDEHIISLRQERPPHLRPEGIHPAMRERGRAIPNTQTVPIVDRARNSRDSPPRIVEGRPGPIPGMRPPMGAGSVHQAQPKGNSMGIIMPLYTIGIIAFFCYTIMKLVFKKPQPNEPYGSVSPNSTFKKEVFGDNAGKYKSEGPTIGCSHQHQVSSDIDINGRKHDDICINHNNSNCANLLCSTNKNETTIAAAITSINSIENTLIKSKTTDITSAKGNITTIATISNSSRANNGVNNILLKNYNNNNINNNNSNSNNNKYSNGHIKTTTENRIERRNSQNKDREQLMEIEWLRRKLEETEKAMAKLIAEMNNTQIQRKDTDETSNQNGNLSNGHAQHHHTTTSDENENSKVEDLNKMNDPSENLINSEKEHYENKSSTSDRKKREGSVEKAVTVMGMELTASFEGGHKWNRPSTPEFPHHQHSAQHFILNGDEKPKSIYLEGSLPHESQILVSDSEITTEKVTDFDSDEDEDEPAVVLSSKISLSLINVSHGDNEPAEEENNVEIDAMMLAEISKDEINEDNQHLEEEQDNNNNEEVSDEN